MKNWISLSVLLTVALTAGMSGDAEAQQHSVTYDRFKNRTTYSAELELSNLTNTSRGVSLSLSSTVEGERAVTKADTFRASGLVTFNMAYGSSCAGTGFDLLVDGKPSSYDSDMSPVTRHGYAILSFGKTMTLAEATAFASAKKVEVRVCGTEYALDDQQQAALRGLVGDAQASRPSGK